MSSVGACGPSLGPVATRYLTVPASLARLPCRRDSMDSPTPVASNGSSQRAQLVFAWLFVSVPLLWGVLQTLKKAAALFR